MTEVVNIVGSMLCMCSSFDITALNSNQAMPTKLLE